MIYVLFAKLGCSVKLHTMENLIAGVVSYVSLRHNITNAMPALHILAMEDALAH